jgi:hypothetical protein
MAYRISKRLRRMFVVMAMVAMAFLVFSDCMPSAHVMAASGDYGSWIRGKDSGYEHGVGGGITAMPNGGGGISGNEIPDPDKDTNDSLSIRFSTEIVKAASKISKDMKEGSVDASVTGVIMAHLTTGNSFFVFDLTDANVYGIIGATIYAALRTLVLGFLFIYVLVRLIVTLYEGDIHGLASMKQILYSAILTMILLFIMPQIVDWVCTARDAIATFLYKRVVALSGGEGDAQAKMLGVTGLEVPYYNMWAQNRSIGNAIIYFMVTVIVPIVYIVSYFKIAIQQTMLFGMYPVFALLGVGDGSMNGKWAVHFFSNAFVPTLDMALIFIPALISKAMTDVGMDDGFLKALIIMACFLSVVPIRNQILSMLGNSFGVQPNIGGALAMGAAAIGGLVAMGKGVAGGIGAYRDSKGGESSLQKQESDASMAEMSSKSGVNDPVPSNAAEKERQEASDNNRDKDGNLRDIPSQREAESQGMSESAEAQNIMAGVGDGSNDETAENAMRAEENAEMANAMLQDRADMAYGAEAAAGAAVYESSTTPEAPSETSGSEAQGTLYETTGSESDVSIPESNQMVGDVDERVSNDVPGTSSEGKSGEHGAGAETVATRESVGIAAASYSQKMGGDAKAIESITASEKRAAIVTNASSKMDKASRSGSKYTDFNQSRLANLENMGTMQQRSASLEKTITTGNASIRTATDAINVNNQKIAQLKSKGVGEDDVRVSKLMAENDAHLRTVTTATDQVRAATNAKERVDMNLANCHQKEAQFAQVYGGSGMSSKSYTSADDFARDMQKAERHQDVANFKNYSSEHIRGYLTPEQRLQYERKENLSRVGRHIGTGIGAGAGAATAVAAYGLASVGGEQAQEQVARMYARPIIGAGGSVGGSLGGKVGGVTSNIRIGESQSVYGDMDDGISGGVDGTVPPKQSKAVGS